MLTIMMMIPYGIPEINVFFDRAESRRHFTMAYKNPINGRWPKEWHIIFGYVRFVGTTSNWMQNENG